jgi:hypothetical protein
VKADAAATKLADISPNHQQLDICHLLVSCGSMAVASEVQQQQQHGQDPAQQHKPCWPAKAWQYARHKPLELAASTLESITLVLVVFVQDLAFKQSIPTCAALLTASFILHGLAYRAGQCQVRQSSLINRSS